jgi:rubrerythrin
MTRKNTRAARAPNSGDYIRIEDMGFLTDVNFNDEKKVLALALENEIRGRELYTQYANTVGSGLAKRVFVHLANEELSHIEDIKEFLKSLPMGINLDVEKMTKPVSLRKTQEFFGKLVEDLLEQIRPTDDDNKSRDVAMAIEKASYEYYRKGAEATRNQKVRKFFKWLMEQEQSHFMLIRNAFEYANNPETWFREQEHWLLEG